MQNKWEKISEKTHGNRLNWISVQQEKSSKKTLKSNKSRKKIEKTLQNGKSENEINSLFQNEKVKRRLKRNK